MVDVIEYCFPALFVLHFVCVVILKGQVFNYNATFFFCMNWVYIIIYRLYYHEGFFCAYYMVALNKKCTDGSDHYSMLNKNNIVLFDVGP